jgi:dTDP-4-amino-4,6-dideoxygalactose transaminase
MSTMTSSSKIPFNRPPLTGNELNYVREALESFHLAGDGPFTKRCRTWLESELKTHRALMTHSCTAALEMSALLADLKPGDEVIMPSFTFVSTANAVVLRGAVPVFVDIRPDTLNLDESKVEAAITPRTKAIFVVHYAGVACEMDPILEIAQRRGLFVFEDAAQGLLAEYKGRALGTIGHLGSLSFHETKNIVSGEGGALLINDMQFDDRAEILREKGTNRTQFFRGQVDKYTWVDVGSSYLPSEILMAVLMAQLEKAREITSERLRLWNHYNENLAALEKRECLKRPIVPAHCRSNGHIYYFVARSLEDRMALITHLKKRDIHPTFHYVPLHSSPAGLKYGRTHGDLSLTTDLSDRLLRLPIWVGMGDSETSRVLDGVHSFYK